jgi:hypothetical protein
MRYKRISRQIGKNVDTIGDAEISFYISAAQQDIQRRLSVVESSTDITLDSLSNLYALPATFGKHKHAYVGDTLLEEISIVEAERRSLSGDYGAWFAIKVSGHSPYVYCPMSSGTLTVIYYPDLNYYQPSLGASQTWGSFNGVVYSGNLILPDRYDMAILYNMLSQIFPDHLALYEKELRSLRESRQFSSSDTFRYSMGGLDDSTSIDTTVQVGTSSVNVSSLDEPSKRLRFIADDLGAYTTQLDYGWSTTPTIVNNVSSIVVSSADSEFTSFVRVSPNNMDFTWSQAGSAIITIYPDPTSGWGEVEIIVEIF